MCPSGDSLEIVEIKVYGSVELSHLLEYVLGEIPILEALLVVVPVTHLILHIPLLYPGRKQAQ